MLKPPEPSCSCVNLRWLESIDMFNKGTRSSDRHSRQLVYRQKSRSNNQEQQPKKIRSLAASVLRSIGTGRKQDRRLQNTAREAMPQFATLEIALVIAVGLALTDATMVLPGPSR